ncbi:Predicted arabinose efflux permease, MFS family [Nocardioides exalbidus]|uniref:Predicted arabinose efflux permease, MFS family n=1 Tax=Nocardioides exalbidus TaxID=402596 RepID=A0A1H5AKR3_9ACTN|nr:MFS transporter [Nocardioides exalbidus]SED42344.1 Predicted arabinose efflux permease, MFS family [Nocardioides exalbidus]
MSRIVETVFPARLGRGFRWLVGSSWVTNLGDGMMIAAGPLLVASQTRNPVLVSGAMLALTLPWLMFGLFAGALADRLDRRRVIMTANAVRGLVLAGLSVVIVTGHVNIAIVLVGMVALGTAETFVDATSGTLTPMLVDKRDLGIANSRLMAGMITGNQLVGPAIGALLFAAGMALPFMVTVVCIALGIVLVSRIGTPPGAVREDVDTHIRKDIAEGVRWLMGNPPVRTLAFIIVVFNVTWAAPWAVLVLWALERVGIGEAGFGLLTTASALGGLVGTFAYGWLEKKVPLASLMRAVLLAEVLFHLAMALTTTPWTAYPLMFFFGAYAFVWGTLSMAVRQRAVPRELQGRVGSVYMICVQGGVLVGSLLGGVIAHYWGLTAPWWFAFVGAGVTLALVWRSLGHIAHADADAGAGTDAVPAS